MIIRGLPNPIDLNESPQATDLASAIVLINSLQESLNNSIIQFNELLSILEHVQR